MPDLTYSSVLAINHFAETQDVFVIDSQQVLENLERILQHPQIIPVCACVYKGDALFFKPNSENAKYILEDSNVVILNSCTVPTELPENDKT